MIQLPNGDWYNPNFIDAIEAHNERFDFNSSTNTQTKTNARVLIHVNKMVRVLWCETFEEAKALRDKIAQLLM